MTTHTLLLLDDVLPIVLGIVTLLGVLCDIHFTDVTQETVGDSAPAQPLPSP